VIDGEVLHGSTGLAGEIGHTIVQAHGRLCGCGQRGCVEAYASASQTVARAKEALATGEASSLRARWEQAGELTCEDVFEHAKAGNTLAGRIAEETATYLALACINLSRFFEPDLIVLSGGLTRAGDYLFDRIRAEIQQHTWKLMPTPRLVVPARLGTDAGVLAAAGLAFYAREQEQDRLQPAVAEAAVRQC